MYALTRALRKLLSLPAGERSLLLEAALLVPLVHALQSALPFRRWRGLLTPKRPPVHAPRGGSTPEQIAAAVLRAQRGVPGVYRCLPAAYAGHLLLHRYGYPSVIHVGVGRDPNGDFEAHAWVECRGQILIGDLPDLGRFVPLPPLTV
jgi:hypothetical protein